MYKLIILLMGVWILLYTLTYAFYEYKKQNRPAAAAIVSLCLVLAVFVVRLVI